MGEEPIEVREGPSDATAAQETAAARLELEELAEQARLLAKQVDDGLYDGDGPADVAETCQEVTC